MDNNEPVPEQPNTMEPNNTPTPEATESGSALVEIPSSGSNLIEDPIADAMKEPESAEAPTLDLQPDASFEQTTEVKTNVSPEAVTESEASAESAPQSETPTEPATEEKVAAPSEATTQPEAPVEPIFEEKTEPKPADFVAPTVATDVKPTVVEKKKSHVGLVFLVIGIVFGVAAVIIAAIFLIPALTKIDYSDTYSTASNLKAKVDAMKKAKANDCLYVEKYVDSPKISVDAYDEYVNNCKNSIPNNELLFSLDETAGIQKNEEMKNKQDSLKAQYDSAFIGLSDKLNIYSTYHNFIVKKNSLTYASTSSEIKTVASILSDTDKDDLKTYGKEWSEKYIAVAEANTDYQEAYKKCFSDFFCSTSRDTDTVETKKVKEEKETELKTYINNNKIDILEAYPLNLKEVEGFCNEFDFLYNMIESEYNKQL